MNRGFFSFILGIILFWGQGPQARADFSALETILHHFSHDYPKYLNTDYNLLIQEYFASRFFDFKVMSERLQDISNKSFEESQKNVQRFNEIVHTMEDLKQLPFHHLQLEALRLSSQHELYRLERAQKALHVLTDAFHNSCHEDVIGWMGKTLKPTLIYKLPVYTFSSDMAASMDYQFYFETSVTFDEDGLAYNPEGLGNGRGSAREQIIYGVCVAAGIAVGTYLGGKVGAIIGGIIGAAVGHTINEIINSSEWNDAYEEYIKKITEMYNKINGTIANTHTKLDKVSNEIIQTYCPSTLYLKFEEEIPVPQTDSHNSDMAIYLRGLHDHVSSRLMAVKNNQNYLNRELKILKEKYYQLMGEHINYLEALEVNFADLYNKSQNRLFVDQIQLDKESKDFFMTSAWPLIKKAKEDQDLNPFSKIEKLDKAWEGVLEGEGRYETIPELTSEIWKNLKGSFYQTLAEENL